MERAYELTVEIGGHDKNREMEIIKACLIECKRPGEHLVVNPTMYPVE